MVRQRKNCKRDKGTYEKLLDKYLITSKTPLRTSNLRLSLFSTGTSKRAFICGCPRLYFFGRHLFIEVDNSCVAELYSLLRLHLLSFCHHITSLLSSLSCTPAIIARSCASVEPDIIKYWMFFSCDQLALASLKLIFSPWNIFMAEATLENGIEKNVA